MHVARGCGGCQAAILVISADNPVDSKRRGRKRRMVSDNVFVATIFIEGIATAYRAEGPEATNMTEAHFGKLGVAISMVCVASSALLLPFSWLASFCHRSSPPRIQQLQNTHLPRPRAFQMAQGTNLPSCATPNGQAAFLFILTSAIAPLVQVRAAMLASDACPSNRLMSLRPLVRATAQLRKNGLHGLAVHSRLVYCRPGWRDLPDLMQSK